MKNIDINIKTIIPFCELNHNFNILIKCVLPCVIPPYVRLTSLSWFRANTTLKFHIPDKFV